VLPPPTDLCFFRILQKKVFDVESDDDIELPAIELPEAEDGSGEAPTPLIDSAWNFYNQCKRLKASKQYKGLPKPEYD
jgi:hypothetical protein